jgi:lipid A 4'-phosphatase
LPALAVALVPAFDLSVSSWFFVEPGSFALAHSPVWRWLRESFLAGFRVWYVLLAAVTIFVLRTGRGFGRWNRDQWLYLATGSVLGPWLLVNVVLKEHWGRWRPLSISEFGGRESFSAPFDWSGTCASNCAFVSGEVASMVMLFIGAALVSSIWRPVFYGAAVLFGALVSVIRIGQGGHFLSDTLAAAGLMAVLAASLLWAFRRAGRAV